MISYKRKFRIFWLVLKASVSVEKPVSVEDTPLCSALLRSVGENKHPRMLLVWGWWSLVLFELSIYKSKFRCHHFLFWFVVPHSGLFWWITITLLNFLTSWIHVFQQTFKSSVRASYGWPPRKKFPSKPKVINTMVNLFLETFRISICKTLLLNLCTF